jgi:hypothetical protein
VLRDKEFSSHSTATTREVNRTIIQALASGLLLPGFFSHMEIASAAPCLFPNKHFQNVLLSLFFNPNHTDGHIAMVAGIGMGP